MFKLNTFHQKWKINFRNSKNIAPLFATLVALICSVLQQIIVAYRLGISPEASTFFLLINLISYTVSILGSTGQNILLPLAIRGDSLNIGKLKEILKIYIFSILFFQILISGILLFLRDRKLVNFNSQLLLLLLAFMWMFLISLTLVQLSIAAGLRLTPLLSNGFPSLTASILCYLHSSVNSLFLGQTIGLFFQIFVLIFALKKFIRLENSKNQYTINIFSYLSSLTQYCFLSVSNVVPRWLMGGSESVATSIYSYADKGYQSLLSLIGTGFIQVFQWDSIKEESTSNISQKFLLSKSRQLRKFLFLLIIFIEIICLMMAIPVLAKLGFDDTVAEIILNSFLILLISFISLTWSQFWNSIYFAILRPNYPTFLGFSSSAFLILMSFLAYPLSSTDLASIFAVNSSLHLTLRIGISLKKRDLLTKLWQEEIKFIVFLYILVLAYLYFINY